MRSTMSAAADTPNGARGVQLLLEHCAVITRLERPRTPAHERLEAQLGGDLTRTLVTALAGSAGAAATARRPF